MISLLSKNQELFVDIMMAEGTFQRRKHFSVRVIVTFLVTRQSWELSPTVDLSPN